MVMPAHQPTPEQRRSVENMAARNLPHDDIAAIVGVSDETLRKYYRTELDAGKARGNLRIADRLYQLADKNNVAALIFLAKVRLGWSEKQRVELTGKDGGPIDIYATMSTDDLRRRLAEINEALTKE